MPERHLLLIGYRGSGKTTIGRALATLLNRDLVDTDAWIVNYAQRSIPQIFEEDGEEAFRELESLAIEQLPNSPPLVVSLGGGAVLRPENRERLKSLGWVVWLRAEPGILAERIARDETLGIRRPSLTGKNSITEIQQVLTAREPIYRALCDWELETAGRAASVLARDIAEWYASKSCGSGQT